MSDIQEKGNGLIDMMNRPLNRRSFLVKTGTAAALGAILVTGISGCSDDSNPLNPSNAIDVGSGDVGVLNYAYALEQLEAAFYNLVVTGSSFSSIFLANEQAILTDIRDHELGHKEFFKAAITAAGATPLQDLTPDFSSVNFSDKNSILNTAKTFEDLGVAAYNGAARYITMDAYLVIAGQIVSVEARHASVIRDLISPNSRDFAGDDVVSATTGLDRALRPNEGVIAAANTYLTTKISARELN